MKTTDLLYIGSNGNVAAFDPGTGEEVWRQRLATGFFSATAYADVCVLEHEGRVFAGCQGHLFCLDGRTGEVVWHNALDGLGHNDVTLSIAGKSIQAVGRTQQSG